MYNRTPSIVSGDIHINRRSDIDSPHLPEDKAILNALSRMAKVRIPLYKAAAALTFMRNVLKTPRIITIPELDVLTKQEYNMPIHDFYESHISVGIYEDLKVARDGYMSGCRTKTILWGKLIAKSEEYKDSAIEEVFPSSISMCNDSLRHIGSNLGMDMLSIKKDLDKRL